MIPVLLCGVLLTSLMADTVSTSGQRSSPSPATATAQSPERMASVKLMQDLIRLRHANSTGPDWAAVDAKIASYQKDFGVTSETTRQMILMRKLQVNIGKGLGNKVPLKALLQTLSTDSIPEIAEFAKKQLEVQNLQAELATKPADLKVTGIDGKEIDISKLRGKVVLIDFWATWSPPSVKNRTTVMETYKKFHDQGFEIVGISLDAEKDKDKLVAFIKDKGLEWPQYFDGKVWDNVVVKQFDITAIPAMWLLDKKGMIATKEAREDLPGQVEKLLKVP